jgi:AcrR family transcriptional regulator
MINTMSPRTPEQNEQVKAATRKRILAAALSLFAEHGYEGTSVRMIADEAGIAIGLLYNYFDGKQALLQAIFEESMADVRESFARADALPPSERLEQLVRGSFEILRGNLTFWRLSYGVRMQPAVLAGLGRDLQQWTAAILRTLEGYLRDAGVAQPDVEAAVLFAVIDGVSQHYVLDPDRYPLEAVIELVVARYAKPRRTVASSRGRRTT